MVQKVTVPVEAMYIYLILVILCPVNAGTLQYVDTNFKDSWKDIEGVVAG